MVIALPEPHKLNNQWPIVGLNDGWNDHNPSGWPEFDINNSWEKSASLTIQEWHYQVPVQQKHHVKSNGWTNNCVTKKPRYLHTEVIYPKVLKKNNEWNYNNEWDSNTRKPSNNEWSRGLSHGEVW